ncbi:hypothetical protein HOY80DRAFT_1005766 [Tuber brumale]|nr:hypothetical protein HOY80DRAFT_1005766 [Tuber brumale]
MYNNITTLLNRVSKVLARNEYLASPPFEITEGGHENGPNSPLKEHKWYRKVLKLQHLLHRLQLVFHPDFLEMRPSAEWVLSHYPANPQSFTNLKRLRRDDRRRVFCIIRDNNAEIRRICRWLSDGVKLTRGDLDDLMQATVISKMESLGEQWALLQAKTEGVVLWFENKWGNNCPN